MPSAHSIVFSGVFIVRVWFLLGRAGFDARRAAVPNVWGKEKSLDARDLRVDSARSTPPQ